MRLWKLSLLLILGIALYGSPPCSWVEHLAPPAQSTAPEKLPFVSFEKAKEYIRAIFQQADPTAQLQIQDESGQLRPLLEFQFVAENVGMKFYAPVINGITKRMISGSHQFGNMAATVRYDDRIGYVFETSKTVKGKGDPSTTARYINKDGDYIDLDQLPLNWVSEVNKAFEKGETISKLRWQKIISLILDRMHPDEPLMVETADGEKHVLTGFRFRVNKVPFLYYEIRTRKGVVRFNSGSKERGNLVGTAIFEKDIGYVFETEKTIEGSTWTLPDIEARYINAQGKYKILDRIPVSWIEECNRTLETGAFIPRVRWRKVIDFIRHRDNPTEPIVIKVDDREKELVGFRFQADNVGIYFYSPSHGKNFTMTSGSSKKGNMTVIVRHEPFGYLFETQKVVKGMGSPLMTARYINHEGKYVGLDYLPPDWVEEFNESLVSGEPAAEIRWQKALVFLLGQKPLGRRIAVRGKDNKIQRLNGFRFRVESNTYDVFGPKISGHQVRLRSGSTKGGYLSAALIYDKSLRGYVIQTLKRGTNGRMPRVNYWMISDGPRGRNYYHAYRRFIARTESSQFIDHIRDLNHKITDEQSFSEADEKILIKEIRKGNRKAYQVTMNAIETRLLKVLSLARDDQHHKNQWPAVEHLASEIVLSYGLFGLEEQGLILKAVKRIIPVALLNIYLMRRFDEEAGEVRLASKIDEGYDEEAIFREIKAFAKDIFHVLSKRGSLDEESIAKIKGNNGLVALAQTIVRHNDNPKIQEFRQFDKGVRQRTRILLEEILGALRDELLRLIDPADGKVQLNSALDKCL